MTITVNEEVEQLKARFENLSESVPEDHPGKIGLQGWFKALVTQAQLLLVVFNLQSIIEKTGVDLGADQELTLLSLAQLRAAAVAAESLVETEGLGL